MLSADAAGEGQGAYSRAGGIATEVLSLVRIVTAYGGQEEEAQRYEEALDEAYKANVRRSMLSGISIGFVLLCILCIYGLAFFYGAQLERENQMSAGDVLLVFFSLTLGATALGQAAPAFKSFAIARGTAPRIFDLIERDSPIDPLDYDSGLTPESVKGEIVFDNVDFTYKNRVAEDGAPDLVFNNFSLRVEAGMSQALVGPSGCGKSTTVRLVERFYDPIAGSVKLDGVDMRELNVKWLRAQVGYVGQMPTLFKLTIRENIALGAAAVPVEDKVTGSRRWEVIEPTEDDIIRAAKAANAHDFIMKLPEGYDTMLGERGALLSGGQKQRICIARALVRNPKILILDESTAALDANSERLVQEALEKASEGRTTITIAHRLSTVRNADRISVIEHGVVVESGKHEELMAREGGAYRQLVQLQNIERQKTEEAMVDDDEQDASDEALPQLSGDKSRLGKPSVTGADSTTIPNVQGEQEEEDGKVDIDRGVLKRTFALNARETPLILLGIIGAAMAGSVWPVASIALVRLVEIMIVDNNIGDVRLWCLVFVAIGAGALVGNFFYFGALGVSGERLTRKLRSLSFRALLRQEMGFFDLKENAVGALATRLSTDASQVKGVTGDTLGAVATVTSSLLTGLIIAFVTCWRVALVVMAIVPGVVAGGYFEMQMSAGLDSGSKKNFSGAGAIASESVDNIVTVRSLGIESHFDNRFVSELEKLRPGQIRKAFITGVAFGFSEFCQFLIWFAAFKAGADFVRQGHCGFFSLLQSVMAILFAAITLGNVAIFFPDIGGSRIAATSIYRLLDRQSLIDPLRDDSDGSSWDSCHGDISATKLRFEYPSRPDVAVLRGLSVGVESGNTLALVGASGCGKSTIISLLERFYDVREGDLNVDSKHVKSVFVGSLRSHLGIVTQDPDLFNRTIRDNIAYGLSHVDGAPITNEMIVNAAKAANAHDFIQELPQKYDTVVGPRGDQLSGGQRQRVAIARSLIRQPKILLLDEATSALDAVSERVVQEALDAAASGRTTITVAHRLSTIQHADSIAVVHRGKIAEQGTHTHLLRLNGRYAELVKNQMTEVPLS